MLFRSDAESRSSSRPQSTGGRRTDATVGSSLETGGVERPNDRGSSAAQPRSAARY